MTSTLLINEKNYILNYHLDPSNNIIVESITDETGTDHKHSLNYAEPLAILQTHIHRNPPNDSFINNPEKVEQENSGNIEITEPAFKESDLSPEEVKMEKQFENLAHITPEKPAKKKSGKGK